MQHATLFIHHPASISTYYEQRRPLPKQAKCCNVSAALTWKDWSLQLLLLAFQLGIIDALHKSVHRLAITHVVQPGVFGALQIGARCEAIMSSFR